MFQTHRLPAAAPHKSIQQDQVYVIYLAQANHPISFVAAYLEMLSTCAFISS